MKEFIFIPGEYTLKSSEEEYKADAAVIYNYLEITLLETSGIFERHAIHRFDVLALSLADYKIHLWTLELCSSKLYASKKVFKFSYCP
ncbi:hypothetical protein HPULCUR_006342 [Helicostylum pulchrum]|uniref:Uncharacterized protein n=1 Tax=Helicostylum pulchrum TaxID=562976 RepID=A0ABP9Y2W8_9FUNG